MSILEDLLKRSQSCELCSSEENLDSFEVAPSDGSVDHAVLLCATCKSQLEDDSKLDANHFRCLNDSMWSEVTAVQVMAYRILNKISNEGWPQDLLEMLYLEDETKAWADLGLLDLDAPEVRDSNGVLLFAGDSVSIIKDLDVKGAGFTAKRGTMVKNISIGDDPTHIGGRVNGVKIYLKTCFLKKM